VKAIVISLLLLGGTGSLCFAQTFDDGPTDGSFTIRGTVIDDPTALKPSGSGYERSLQDRLSTALNARDWDCNATSRGDTDNGKRYWPLLLAQMAKAGGNVSGLISNQGESGLNNQYEGTFYKPFSCPGLCTYYFGYYDKLPSDQKNKVKNMWFDTGKKYTSRKDGAMDPIYDKTEFNSENFNWMARLAGYLLSHHFNDDTGYYDTYVKNWVRAAFNAGRGEWGSDIYWAYCINPVLVLYEYAQDMKTKLRARAVLDWMMLEAAFRHVDGFSSSAGSRQKGTEMIPFNGADWFYEWLYFTTSDWSASFSATAIKEHIPMQMIGFPPHMSYHPPQVILDIAHRDFDTPVEMHNAKPYIHLDHNNYKDWKGASDAGRRFEFETVWIEKNYTLGSIASYRPAARAQLGANNQTPFVEQGLWRIAIRQSSGGALRLVGSAGDQTGGGYKNARYPYEEIGQYRNVMMRLVKGSENKLYVISPKSISFDFSGKNAFADAGSGVYLAFLSHNCSGTSSAQLGDDKYADFTRYTWSFSSGKLGGLVLEAGTKEEYGDFGSFKSSIQNNLGTLSSPGNNQLQYTSTSEDGGTIKMEWQGPTTYHSTVFNKDINPAGNVPKVWGDGKYFDFEKWQSYKTVYGTPILEQHWGSGALTAWSGTEGLQIIVDPESAEVEYRSFDSMESTYARNTAVKSGKMAHENVAFDRTNITVSWESGQERTLRLFSPSGRCLYTRVLAADKLSAAVPEEIIARGMLIYTVTAGTQRVAGTHIHCK
jgi:hypothetical protein